MQPVTRLKRRLLGVAVAAVVAVGTIASGGGAAAQDPPADEPDLTATADEFAPASHRDPAAEVVPDRRDLDPYRLHQVTLAGSHNTYDKRGGVDQVSNALGDDYEYVFESLADSQVIEFDVYAVGGQWIVNHGFPGANPSLLKSVNTCPKSGDYDAPRDQDLKSCLEGLRKWHDRHPDHPLVIVKLEFKAGFLPGNTPAELDRIITTPAYLPRPLLYTPADLMCRGYPTCNGTFSSPDEAARAGNWPRMADVRGKFMFVTVTGAWTSSVPIILPDGARQYAEALQAGSASVVFPSLLLTGAPAGTDPRLGFYGHANVARWNVVFDMEKGPLPVYGGNGQIAQSVLDWMGDNNYLKFLTLAEPARPCTASPDPSTCRAVARERLCPTTTDPARCVALAEGSRAPLLVDLVAGNRVVSDYVAAVRPNVVDIDQDRAGLVIARPLPTRTGQWDSLGGSVSSAPAAAAWGNGFVELFVRGSDNALWTRSFGARGWTPWTSLGGVLTSDPTGVAFDDGVVAVYVRGGDAYWHRVRRGGVWSNWTTIGGVLTSGPGAVSATAGRVEVFGRATDGELWQYTHALGGGDVGWRKVGGRIESDPDAISWGPGVVDLAARGPAGDVVRRVFNGQAWGGWESLGGAVTSAPALAAWPNHWEAFVRGSDGAVWRKFWTPPTGFVGWGPELGGFIVGDPDAIATPAHTGGTVDVYVRGGDNAVYHRRFAP